MFVLELQFLGSGNIRMKRRFVFLLLVFSLLFNSFCFAETAEPYDTSELPESLLDLRRFEIVTLGSLPFVMLDSTLAYSTYRFAVEGTGSPTPFASSSNFSTDEQMGLVLTSLGISVGIGLTDLIIRIIKRGVSNKRIKKESGKDIQIIPVTENPDAVRIQLPSETNSEKVEE